MEEYAGQGEFYMNDFDYLIWLVGMTLYAMAMVITLPVWIIPYLIYKVYVRNR